MAYDAVLKAMIIEELLVLTCKSFTQSQRHEATWTKEYTNLVRIKVWVKDDHSIGSLLRVSYYKGVTNEEKRTYIEIDSNTLCEMWSKNYRSIKEMVTYTSTSAEQEYEIFRTRFIELIHGLLPDWTFGVAILIV